MDKSKKNWILLGITVLAIFFMIKIIVEFNQNEAIKEDKVYCPEERGDACTMDYNPVCGWYNSKEIQCINYPCAQTYSNGCSACVDKNIEYYTKGDCPKK